MPRRTGPGLFIGDRVINLEQHPMANHLVGHSMHVGGRQVANEDGADVGVRWNVLRLRQTRCLL